METSREIILCRRIKGLTLFFIIALVLSGATAIPLTAELDALSMFDDGRSNSAIGQWIGLVRTALHRTHMEFPFLFYGTDWLAFGHFVIAIAYIGALRDPIRNSWLYTFGMIACVLIVPYALAFGAVRGIPLWWRFVDCSFGVFGFVPVWFCKKWTEELEQSINGMKRQQP